MTLEKLKTETANTIRLGAPIVAAQLVQMSMGFVDAVMAGHLSAKALAAVAVGGSLIGPVFLGGMGVLVAINPVVAHLSGADEPEEIGKNLWQGLWLSQIMVIPVFLALRNAGWVMLLFGINPELIPITQGYLNAFSCGLPAAFGFFALRFFNEGLQIAKPSMYIALVGSVVNVAGNYAFMYGHFGFPALGAVGTGWSTALVQWTMFACMARFTFRRQSDRQFHIRAGLNWPQWHYLKEIMRVGIPNGMSFSIEVALFAIVALIMGSMGVITVAAHQVTINFAAFTFMLPLGLSIATTARVGFAMGRRNLQQARMFGFIGMGLSLAIMSVTAFVMIVFPEVIVRIYTQDVQVRELAVKLLFLAGLFQISDGLQVAAFGALRGMKDTKIPMVVNIISYWLVGFTSGYGLGMVMGLGAEGLWIGLIAGLSVAAVLHSLRFHRLTKNKSEDQIEQPEHLESAIEA
ncbi:MAG: MATE family efflux transporter [bacterium]